jgi:hypothetical protein
MENCGGHLLREEPQKMTRCISSLLIIIKIKKISIRMSPCSVGAKQKKPNFSDE